MKSTTGKKWSNFWERLQWILKQSSQAEETDTVGVRRIAGLGINITEIYPEERPYLKGLFNALESWRG